MNAIANLRPRTMLLVLAGVVVLLILIGNMTNKTPAAASSPPPAHITMLHGAGTDNYCKESPGEARIYVSFTLRNDGDTDGTVAPWATFDYSDGGSSTENFFNSYGHDLAVPAHTEVDATFYHTYNPQQHALLRCIGLRDLADSTGYYLPIH